MNAEILKTQIQIALAYAAYWNTRAITGAYKDDKVHRGAHDGPLLTQDELLKRDLATSLRHLQRAQECADALASVVTKPNRAGMGMETF